MVGLPQSSQRASTGLRATSQAQAGRSESSLGLQRGSAWTPFFSLCKMLHFLGALSHCKFSTALLHCSKGVAFRGIFEIVRKIFVGIRMFVFSDYYF